MYNAGMAATNAERQKAHRGRVKAKHAALEAKLPKQVPWAQYAGSLTDEVISGIGHRYTELLVSQPDAAAKDVVLMLDWCRADNERMRPKGVEMAKGRERFGVRVELKSDGSAILEVHE